MADDMIMTGMRAVAPLAFTAGAAGVALSMGNPVLSGPPGTHGGGIGAFVLAGSALLTVFGAVGMGVQGRK